MSHEERMTVYYSPQQLHAGTKNVALLKICMFLALTTRIVRGWVVEGYCA